MLNESLRGARVFVTGGGGFVGRNLLDQIAAYQPDAVFAPRSKEVDLRSKAAIRDALQTTRPDVVIHLAALVGGIGANQANPGRFFYENLIMGVELMEESRQLGLKKFVAVGTICAYPKFTPVPFKEGNLWNGYPEETNAPYGLAKKMLLVQAQAYRRQYGFNAIFILPVNIYGPRDNFAPESSHVIPAMIRKFFEAQQSGAREVVLWGDGSPTREFIHVRDAARGILMAAQRYDGDDPVNIGSGYEISIRALATVIAKEIGYTGRIVWDTTKPNGQPRRALDVTRARERFGFVAEIPFATGIRESIAWYRASVTGDGERT